MKELLHLLKFDFVLLQRNQLLTISAIVSAIYVLVFRGLSSFGNVEQVLVLVIFNDPALLGFMFVGVLYLFEKNEGTLEVLAVSPVSVSNYILSKTIALTCVSLVCCFIMVFACYGFNFNYFHFGLATIFSTFIFTMLGYIAVAGQKTFNQYMLRAIGIILLASLPFLSYFGVASRNWFLLFPTLPAIDLYTFSFTGNIPFNDVIVAYGACILWSISTFSIARKLIKRELS